MSGWLLLGLPGAVYLGGLTESWIVVGLLVGALLNWIFVAPRLRFLSSAYGQEIHTLPQLMGIRTSHLNLDLRFTCSVVLIIFFTVYTSAGFVAAAKLATSVLGWDYTTGVLVGAFITMLYTMIGGFLAVSWTDAFQALLMLLALVAIPVIAFTMLDGAVLDVSMTSVGLLGTISLLAWGLGYFGQPHILARFMAIEKKSEIGKARLIGMSWMTLASIGAILIALTGTVLVPNLEDAETVFIDLAQLLLNPWIAGILIAAILAAVMSTVDSQLIVASSSIVNDVLQVRSRPLMKSRFVVLGVAIVAAFFAMDENSVILDIVAYAWAGLGASFGPCVLFCCYWRGTTGHGLVAGVIVGAGTTIAWHHLGGSFPDSFGLIYEIIPAFIAASLAIAVVSQLTNDQEEISGATVLDDFKDSLNDVHEV